MIIKWDILDEADAEAAGLKLDGSTPLSMEELQKLLNGVEKLGNWRSIINEKGCDLGISHIIYYFFY